MASNCKNSREGKMTHVLHPEDVDFLARAVDEARGCIEIERGRCTADAEARIARAVIEAHFEGERRFQLIVAKGVLAAAEPARYAT
jgi:hypothetical protein